MAQWLKELATKLDDLSLLPGDPHGRRRELILMSCSQTNTNGSVVCMHTHPPFPKYTYSFKIQ